MKHPPPLTTSELRQEVLAAWQTLRRLRDASTSKGVIAGGELAEAEKKYEELARQYATHRIIHNKGPDPQVLDGETFEDVLYSMAAPGRFAKHIPKTKTSCLTRSTMTTVLTSGTKLSGILKALTALSAARDAFDQHTPLRRLIRRWAEQTRSDPFIGQCLQDVSAHVADFSKAIGDATSLLNNLRVTYEKENDGAARLTVERGDRGRLEVVAASAWQGAAKAGPDQVHKLYERLAAAELAAGRIEYGAKDVNRELSRFFAQLVPRYFALLSKLPRQQRKDLIGGVRLSPALAARLVEAAETTDFVADPDSELGFQRKSLPKRFRPLAEQQEYKRVRQAMHKRKVQDATTVIVRRKRPAQSAETHQQQGS